MTVLNCKGLRKERAFIGRGKVVRSLALDAVFVLVEGNAGIVLIDLGQVNAGEGVDWIGVFLAQTSNALGRVTGGNAVIVPIFGTSISDLVVVADVVAQNTLLGHTPQTSFPTIVS